MPLMRYDTYGFYTLDLESASVYVETALNIRLELRESSYCGLYYSGGTAVQEYLLSVNDEESAWHELYPDCSVILRISELPDMDGIRDRLTAGHSEPVLLRSVVKDWPDDDQDEGDQDGGDQDEADQDEADPH